MNKANKILNYSGYRIWGMALLLSIFLSACGSGDQGRDPVLGGSGANVEPAPSAPTVTETTPSATTPAATDIAVNSNITATFDKSMSASTISTSSFTVECPAATGVAGVVSYDDSNQRATFNPTDNLPYDTTCTATISVDAEDTEGFALEEPFVWQFVTAMELPPRVTATAPAATTPIVTGVPINSVVTATFDKDMAPASITTSSFTLACPAGVSVVGAVSYVESSRVATFDPAASLPPNTTCTATVNIGATDTNGVPLAADFVWQFKTGLVADTTRPRVTFTVPVTTTPGPTTDIATNTAVTATFTEDMAPATFIGTTFTLTGPGLTAIPGNVTYSVGARTATFTPTSALPNSTVMTATVTTAATDLAGNALAGNQALLPAASNYIWTFETAAAPDTTGPTITLENPADLDIDVPVNADINATFSEDMEPLSIDLLSFILQESGPPLGADIDAIVNYDVPSRVATLNPTSDLLQDTNYTVTVTTAATDLAGNALVPGLLPNPWTFQTEAAPPPPALAINLGAAASFGLASRGGLTSTGVTVVNGDVALHPTAACTDSTGNAGASQTCLTKIYTSPTGMTVNGSIYFNGDPFDGGATALAVTTDLNVAWVEGKAKIDTFPTGFLGGELGGVGPAGKVLAPGVYHEAALGMSAGSVTTFDGGGDGNAIFIIKVDSSFVDSGTLLLPNEIKLVNGAKARNIWFVLGLDGTIGSGTTWFGNILAGRTIVINNGSTVVGRALAGASGAGDLTLTSAASPAVTTVTVP